MNTLLETTRGAITVRQAIPEDARPLRKLRLESLANHPSAFAADHNMTEAESVEDWAQRIQEGATDDKGVICIASAQAGLIGMTGLFRGRWPKTQHSGVIWGVYVKADWRGLGVAGALLEACTNWGGEHGLTIVKLAVVTTNTAAIRCYTCSGFSVYGIEPQVIHYEGVFYDELLMAKAI